MTDPRANPTAPTDDERRPLFDPAAAPMPATEEFLAACAAAGIELEPDEVTRLGRYLAFLAEATQRINLTAIVAPAEMWMRHIFDSLTLLPVIASLDRAEGRTELPLEIIDVGSGGGLPGIPLAIVLPAARVTLLEATGKKARFLESVAAALGLGSINVLQARAEDAGRDRVRQRDHYDVVVSRAVGPLATLAELTVPFACVNGTVLAIKGAKASEEIAEAKAALHALHAHVLEPIRTLTGTIVPLVKMRQTPKLYPRRAGEAKRAPIR